MSLMENDFPILKKCFVSQFFENFFSPKHIITSSRNWVLELNHSWGMFLKYYTTYSVKYRKVESADDRGQDDLSNSLWHILFTNSETARCTFIVYYDRKFIQVWFHVDINIYHIMMYNITSPYTCFARELCENIIYAMLRKSHDNKYHKLFNKQI